MTHGFRISFYLVILMSSLYLMAGCDEKGRAPTEQKAGQEKAETPIKPVEAVKSEEAVSPEQKNITENLVIKEVKSAEEPQVKSGPPVVKLETSKGDIIIELNQKAAPITVANFLIYVKAGYYDNTVFHRVIPNFMVQGGGFDTALNEKQSQQSIRNESSNSLMNERGTIAMARTLNPDSATCQFFINHKDNANLNYGGPSRPGYAVFGKVIKGIKVVDSIASVKTGVKTANVRVMDGSLKPQQFQDVPIENVIIKKASLVSGN